MASSTPALEIFNMEWKNVKGILEELENLFTCEVCGSPVNNPCTLGGCEHFFCKSCIEDMSGTTCPVCKIPSHVKDVQQNRQIANAVAICTKIKELVNATDDGETSDIFLSPERSSTNEAPHSSFYVDYTFPRVSVSSPVASRTRRIETRKPSTATPTPNAANSSGRMTKQPASQVKNVRKATNRRKAATEARNADDTDDGSDDEVSENQTVHIARKRTVKTTRKKGWDSVVGQDDEKENVAMQRTPRDTPRPSTSGSAARNSRNKPQNDFSLQETPVQSRRKSTPSARSVDKSSERSKRQSRVGISTDLPSTPTTQGSAMNRSFASSPATPSSRVKKNAKGETPLHVAAIKGDVQQVRELLLEGASPNVKDNAGWTPLHEAVNHGFVEIASLLIDHGALINVPGMDNDTPLHDAVVNNRTECVQLLVDKGANTMARNIYGKTPIDVATDVEIKRLLKRTTVTTPNQQEEEDDSILEIHQVVVMATGLSREQKIKLQKCCSLLHWKLVDDFQPDVTHVVTSVNKDGMCPRTMKYLHAILSGKWIVNFEWVEMSMDFKQRVCEDAFEVPGTSTCPDSYAPQRARKNFQKQCPGLLDGCHFYLQGDFSYPTPEKEELQELIKTGGGRLVTREIKADMLDEMAETVPYHADKSSRVSHFIIHDRKNVDPYLLSPRLASVPVSWILDSIAQFKLIPVQL